MVAMHTPSGRNICLELFYEAKMPSWEMGALSLSPVQDDGVWRVQITWANESKRLFGKFDTKQEAEKCGLPTIARIRCREAAEINGTLQSSAFRRRCLLARAGLMRTGFAEARDY
jgi:hypothetical protein